MADVGVLPTLIGQGWSVKKTPTWQTRIQRAVSGRELRLLDYPYPLWRFELTYGALGDNLGLSSAAAIGTLLATDLRTLMGFFLACQGAFSTFLYVDPTDNAVVGQTLPAAISAVAGSNLPAPTTGTGYQVGDVVQPPDNLGAATAAATWEVLAVNGSGAITNIQALTVGAYTIVPGNPLVPLAGGHGSGGQISVSWATTTQLVRTLIGTAAGFMEPIVAPNLGNSFALYYDGIVQPPGYNLDPNTGIVELTAPFTSAQPVITADFSYYFRCRFMADAYEFENFMERLWSLNKLDFISVRP